MFRSTSLFFALFALSACDPEPDSPEPTSPGELRVGLAARTFPAPVGIGTVGFGGFGVSAEPSPFAEIYPATTRIHSHPGVEVLVLSRGEGHETIWVRLDTVGVFQQLRSAVVLALQDRLGQDFDDALIIGATHTHSGPGRIVDGGGPYDLIADRFLPQHYSRMVDAIVDTIELAYTDLRPGRLATQVIEVDEGYGDRRCEDGEDYVNHRVPMLAVEREGALAALMLAIPIHGTVLGIDDLTLSQDVAGSIEHRVEAGFDHPVQVSMFNAWGADMAPRSGATPAAVGASLPGGYDEKEEIASLISGSILSQLGALDFSATPTLWTETHRSVINREAIGYEAGVFPYPYGGVYCSGGPEDCDTSTVVAALDQACVPFPAEYSAPQQTEFTVGQVGSLTLLTFPGEPGTKLAEQVIAQVQSRDSAAGDMLFLGYSQDYLGYSILEEDWWQGGYEASGALWGPRQGAYLADQLVRHHLVSRGLEAAVYEPGPTAPFDVDGAEPWQATAPVGLGELLLDAGTALSPDQVLSVTVLGDDPWWGTPIATLEHADGTAVLASNGLPVDSRSPDFWTDLAPSPSYREAPTATQRSFAWTISFAPRRHFGSTEALQPGVSYRLHIALPTASGELEAVYSGPFQLQP